MKNYIIGLLIVFIIELSSLIYKEKNKRVYIYGKNFGTVRYDAASPEDDEFKDVGTGLPVPIFHGSHP